MKKIGLLFGMEDSFPTAILERIIRKNEPGVTAEFIKYDAMQMSSDCEYDVILDRVSHEVPFYRSILKLAMINGVKVINNPFWGCAEDIFFHSGLAHKLKFKVPKTVVLPTKELPPGTTSETMRNLVYPLDWENIFAYVGFPAYLKPNFRNGTHNFFKVYSPSEFFTAYDLTGSRAMILQECIEYEEYYRCCVIGKKYVRTMNFDPTKPHNARYSTGKCKIKEKTKEIIEQTSIKLCETTGFDFNSVEFAVRNGEAWIVDFLNPSPTADKAILKESNFEWYVENTANYLIECALANTRQTKKLTWKNILTGGK